MQDITDPSHPLNPLNPMSPLNPFNPMYQDSHTTQPDEPLSPEAQREVDAFFKMLLGAVLLGFVVFMLVKISFLFSRKRIVDWKRNRCYKSYAKRRYHGFYRD